MMDSDSSDYHDMPQTESDSSEHSDSASEHNSDNEHNLFAVKVEDVSPASEKMILYTNDIISKSDYKENKKRNKNEQTNRGGAHNTTTYSDKRNCLEEQDIAQFLQYIRCGCKNDCLHKVAKLGKTGHDIVLGLRTQRFQGL